MEICNTCSAISTGSLWAFISTKDRLRTGRVPLFSTVTSAFSSTAVHTGAQKVKFFGVYPTGEQRTEIKLKQAAGDLQ